MATKVFKDIPELVDLMPSGGRPGFEYAIISTGNIVRAQREGWDTIDRISAFEIQGPTGNCPVMLMGKGEPVYGAAPQTVRAKSWIDPEICEATGIYLPGDSPQVLVAKPSAEAPKPKVTAASIISQQKPTESVTSS